MQQAEASTHRYIPTRWMQQQQQQQLASASSTAVTTARARRPIIILRLARSSAWCVRSRFTPTAKRPERRTGVAQCGAQRVKLGCRVSRRLKIRWFDNWAKWSRMGQLRAYSVCVLRVRPKAIGLVPPLAKATCSARVVTAMRASWHRLLDLCDRIKRVPHIPHYQISLSFSHRSASVCA